MRNSPLLLGFIFAQLNLQTLGYASGKKVCEALLANNPFRDFAEVVHLVAKPKQHKSTRQTDDLQRASGKGFAVLDTTAFFPEDLMHRIFSRFPKPSTVILVSSDVFTAGDILSDSRKKARLSKEELSPFIEYLKWLSRNLNQILPVDEQIQITGADLRISAAGGKKNIFPKWHQDGGYIAAAVSLIGSGTEYLFESPLVLSDSETLPGRYRNATKYGKTPRGQTLLFSGTDRFSNLRDIAPTLHRSPTDNTDRMFLIVRYQLKR